MKKLVNKLRFLWHSLFFGMRNADRKMLDQISNGDIDGSSTEDKLEKSGTVWEDLINKQETERVAEFRDEQYRIYREAENYKVDTDALRYDSEGNVDESSIVMVKKSMIDPRPSGIYLQDNEELILEQLNNQINLEFWKQDIFKDNEPLSRIKIERDFTPRFMIEKYIKKVVVKKKPILKQNRFYLDLYFSKYPKEFNVKGDLSKPYIDKSDVFLIKELEELNKDIHYKTDLLDFNTLEFVTENAYNASNLMLYKYADASLANCKVFDGNYVVTLEATCIVNGFDLISQYKTADVDKKYNTNEQKTDTFSVNTFTMPDIVEDIEITKEDNLT